MPDPVLTSSGGPAASATSASPARGGLDTVAARYAIAGGALVLGWGARFALAGWGGSELPTYVTFYPAIMAAALLGGRGPGLLVTALCALGAAIFLLPPAGVAVGRAADIVGLLLFCGMGVFMTALADAYRATTRKAAGYEREIAVREAHAASERALRHSETSYRLLMEQAADGIFVADAACRCVEVNEAGLRMFGYSREEMLTKGLPDLIVADEADRVVPEVMKLADGAVITSEWRCRRKDGSEFLGEVVGRQVPDGRLQGIVRDISARAGVEAKLRRERALLATITATTDAMLVYLDPDFNFVWVNQAYADTCRMSAEELIGKNHFALFPHAENEAIFRRVRDTGIPTFFKDKAFEFPDQPVRGVTYWDRSLNAVRDESGRTDGLVLSLRETTAHVRAQHALRESEERYRRLFENMVEGFALLEVVTRDDDPAGDLCFVDVNPAFERLTGLGRAKVAGRRLFDVLPGMESDWIVECGAEAGGKRVPFEKYFPTLGRWYEIHAHQSGPRDYAVLFVDTTDRRQAEDALKAAKAEAERANDAKSRFLAAASHDLRQPLTGLSLYARVLKTKLGEGDAGLQQNIENCIKSLSELLTDLLDLSKLQAGVVEPKTTEFAVGELLARLASTHAPEAQAKGLALRHRPSRLIARSDPILLGRLLGNLMDNALRYTERGGVLIGCRRRAGKVWIEVWDTGMGIPADKTGEIFEEFRQLGNDERGDRKGSGLGLAIVARVAGLLGLAIRVRSRPSHGSLFAIELPVSSTLPAIASAEVAAHRPVRVGLVEDNRLVLQALVSALEAVGHQVVAAASADALLASLGSEPPDLVISDYRLSAGQSGFDVVTRLRAAFGDPLPAVIITGDTDPGLMRSMATRGITVLHKPLKMDALEACIAAVSDRPTPLGASSASS